MRVAEYAVVFSIALFKFEMHPVKHRNMVAFIITLFHAEAKKKEEGNLFLGRGKDNRWDVDRNERLDLQSSIERTTD